MVKGAWSDFLVISVSNKFIYKPVILESYRLLPMYTSRIGLFSLLEIFEVNMKIISWNTKIKQNASWTCLEKGIVWFRPPNNYLRFIQPPYYASVVNKTNFRSISVQCTQVYF